MNLHSFLGIVIQETPWRMKSKYLMLTSLLCQFGVKEGLNEFPCIPDGLVYSLPYTHLVSAGADCYRCLLKGMDEAQWQKHFYLPFKCVLKGKDRVSMNNLMSYWMPVTLKTHPVVLNQLLHDVTGEVNPPSMFAVAALYKHGRKTGLLPWEQIDSELLKGCLAHICDDVRGEAFAAVCACTKTTSLPFESEIEMVRLFVVENVNVDSSSLRQVIVVSFKIFICRVRDVHFTLCFGNQVKALPGSEGVINFFHWLLKYIIDNFVPGVNYQRRITCLLLLGVVLDSISHGEGRSLGRTDWCECSFRDGVSEQDWKGPEVHSLLLNALTDSVADVRDAASAILKKHFVEPSDSLLIALWGKAMTLCTSSLFYEVESGAVLVDNLMHWRLRRSSAEGALGAAGMVDDLLSQAEHQRHLLEANMVQGALHAPVHGILSALHRIISCPDAFARLGLRREHVATLLALVDGLSVFALEALSSKPHSQLEVAPSFAEMGFAIDVAVSESIKCLGICGDGVEPSVSELVLNCLWLNMKVCCALASTLCARSLSSSEPFLSESEVEGCGRLLVRVLTKCRHKGAIESAGKSLSLFATSCASSQNAKLKDLPQKMLIECLERTFVARDARASITRRSAGLSILVHRLITADPKNNVPTCVPKLLRWAEIESPLEESQAEVEDIPQAQALHFLRPIVQDSAMHRHLSPYMSDIALVCFKNLCSKVWAVRNAALQLFGALTPKLIGQKKDEVEDVVGSNVTIEELHAHYPQLFEYMLQELKESVFKLSQESALTPDNLLPILTLCSRMTRGVPSMHSPSMVNISCEFLSLFQILLSSRCIAIRKSCARAVAAFTPLGELSKRIESLVNELSGDTFTSENDIHGRLLCIKALKDRLEVDSYSLKEYALSFKGIEKLVLQINISKEKCYFSRALLFQIQGFARCDVFPMLRMYRQKSLLIYNPGWMQLAIACLDSYIVTCSENGFIPFLEECYNSGACFMQAGLHSLSRRLEKIGLAEVTKQELMNFLIVKVCDSDASTNATLDYLNVMMRLCSNSSVTLPLHQMELLFQNVAANSNHGIGCLSAALAVIAMVVVRSGDGKESRLMAARVVTAVHGLCLPNNLEEIRLDAVRVLASFLPIIQCCRHDVQGGRALNPITAEIIASILDSAIILLQDENSIVRTKAAEFVSAFISTDWNGKSTHVGVNSQKCISTLISGITSFLPVPMAVKFLWDKLMNSMKPLVLRVQDRIQSPFDHGVENFYSEEVIIAKLSGESLKILANRCGGEFCDSMGLSVYLSQLQQTGADLLSHMAERTGAPYLAYSELYLSVVSLKYLLETAILLGLGDTNNLQSLLSKLESSCTKVFARELNC
ncbi:thyroid adenoma-associated protein homolog isoform X2 [Ischnura elegans]|nr:thyroid adenoma-associated protein homolog isoform X2 [Ischnura elegans]